MNYYQAINLTNRITRIIDKTGVCCYLIIGDDKACLLDTCCGYGDIKEFVKTITDKPLFVILTHGHYDHTGGSSLFDEVYMKLVDIPVFNKHLNSEMRDVDFERFPQIQGIPVIPTRTTEILPIVDYQVFDLGNLHIKMIPVEGHTPGMICPLIIEERTIIFGDACGVSVLLFDEYSSTVSNYRDSLLNLKKYENEYDTVYRNHGTFFSNKDLLDNVIECCDLILSGKDDHEPAKFLNMELFAAKKVRAHGRIDGKEGNILYSLDKAK